MRKLSFIIICFTYSFCYSNINKVDSIWNKYNTSKHDTLKIQYLFQIGEILENENPDSAISIYNNAFEIALNIEDKNYQSMALKNSGYVFINIGDFSNAIIKINESLIIDEELKDSLSMAQCYNNIGVIYDITGKYDKAIDYYLKSLNIKERLGDKKSIGYGYTNIGVIHDIQKNFTKAIEYYNKALNIFTEIHFQKGIVSCILNLGISNSSMKKYDSALEYFNKAIIELQDSSDLKSLSACYSNIGSIYENTNDYKQSLNYYFKALKIKNKISDYSESAGLYINIGRNYLMINKIDSALIYTIQGKELAIKTNTLSAENSAYLTLSNIYANQKDYLKSLEYFRLYNSTKDSLFSSDKSRALTEMETKYQTEKKEKEIELLNKDKDLQSKEIQKQTILRNSFIIGFGLIFLVAIFIYKNFRNKKKANQLLTQKNTEIEQQKEEISAQRDQLEVTNSKLQTSNQKLETLNSELEKLSIVASETDNSVVITNEKGEIEWVNDGFTRLFEYTKDEFIEKFGSNIKKSSKNKDIENAIKECIKERKTVVYITLNQTKSGKTIWIQTTLTPILKDEILFKLVAIDSDISKLKEAEEEIKQQKEELEAQSELLMQTNNQLELKNNQITDSIRYAKQIQDAMLPDLSPKSQAASSKLQNMEFDAFVFFKPKDIVSGDFYWFTKTSEYTFIAVADCTGHGVPGAFMSMIGNTLLNEIIAQKKIYSLSKILIKLDEGVNFAINKQNNSESSQEDGMEISICRIDSNNNEIDIASTNQSVYAFNDNEITIIEGGIYSIGGSSFSNKTFETHKIKLKENTKIYLLSDGFQDQFGGENRKKFGSTQLKELIKSANKYPFNEQKMIFESEFNLWRGTNKQIDDITVIGINL